MGLGSEVLQGLVPNGRNFDPIDIAANVVGSLAALGLCTLYHKRMLERKRRLKGYGVVPQEGEDDLELGQGVADAHADDQAWDDVGEDQSEEEDRTAPSVGLASEGANGKK